MGKPIVATAAVIYARKSTDRQETSLPEQLAWAHRAGELNRLAVAAVFSDEAVSGSEIARRDGLQQLIRFCEGRKDDPVKVVICWAMDRLSRSDVIDTYEVLAKLRRSGVRSILTNARTYDLHSLTDKVLLSVEQDFSNSGYVRKLSENTTRALHSRAKQGRWLGRVPYAYVIGTDGRLTPGDPERVEAVRWLFATYAATGASLRELARELERRGVPPPKGEWNRYTVYTLLHNEAYAGVYRWNASHAGRHCRVQGGEVTGTDPGGRRRAKNDASDAVVIEDAHPALVDRETFRAAQKRLERNRGRRTTPTRGRVWPLSGVACCGNCGGRMVGRVDKQHCNGRTYTYEVLYCSRSGVRGCDTCRTHRVPQQRVLAEVAALIRERLTDPEHLADLRREVEAVAASEDGNAEADRARLRTRLADLDRKLDQGAEAILTCPKSARERAAAKLAEWEAERDGLARELAGLEIVTNDRQGVTARVAEALNALAHLEEAVASDDRAAVRDLFASVVDGVRLRFGHGRKLKNGGRRTYLSAVEVDLLPEVSHLLSKGTRTLWPR